MNSAISLSTLNTPLPAFFKIAGLRPDTLIKRGESVQLKTERVYESEHLIPGIFSKISDDSEMLIQFKKFAEELRQIAPKAKDFLYFSAIMMHAAEAALLDQDGTLKKDANGKELISSWDKHGESWRWNCSDPNVKPYKNSNNDIFPEEELIKAHKKWVGRPLCLDHKSSSVDMIRGVIVDTYYDRNKKRVVALCALDKINYPDLARKVSTGVAASVSMGTAVGKAICTENGCHRVARVEADFCDHMRKKNGYGEINIDLSPIELSIVVNGADPQAKIRYIVAAADSIAKYINMKQNELHKLAEDETRDIELSEEALSGLDEIRNLLLTVQQKIERLKGNEEAEQVRYESGTKTPVVEAAEDLIFKQVVPMINSITQKLGQLDEKFNKLVAKDIQMTQKNAYFQGAGGVNEPTPGRPKYEKEEADSIRNNQDKHMESPQDTGPVDGLFPGDEQKKKELLRAAEVQQRELKRQAALKRVSDVLQKGAYYQSAGGVNEPTPGKSKYPKEEADKIRNTEDKQQVGAPPFPGVGKLDGLYDKDLENKKKLLRAKLTAKFIKAAKSDGTLDQGESRWQVYADDKLIMTATVNEITGRKAESLYSSVATKEFGYDLIARIKTEGFDKAASLYKDAQALGGAAPAPAAPLPGGAGSPMAEPLGGDLGGPGGPGGEDAGLDQGKSGDPKETISDISHQLSNLSADLSQAVDALNEAPANELQDFDQLAGGAPEGSLPATAASTLTLSNMQKKLSQALVQGIRQTCVDIKDHQEELKLANMLVSDTSIMKEASAEKKQTINTMVKDACDDAKRTLADGIKLMGAFVKYARGTQSLVKRANKEVALMKKTAQFAPSGMPGDPMDPTLPGDKPSGAAYTAPKTMGPNLGPAKPGDPKVILPKTKVPAKPVQPSKPQDTATHIKDWPVPYGDRSGLETQLINVTRESPLGGQFQTPQGQGPSGQMADDGNTADTEVAFNDEMEKFLNAHFKDEEAKKAAKKALEEHKRSEKKDDKKDVGDLKVSPDGGMEGTPEEVGKAMKEKEATKFDINTKEGRALYRAKLAEKGLTFSDMLTKAHGKGGFTTQLDVKPTGDLAKVETLEETHKAMMDIANAPPKVRKQAEEIQRYVAAGQINPATDFEGLIAQGLDSDAVKYWKSYWGQSKDGGSDFGAKLVQDYSNKKVAEEKEAYKVKVLRAFSLANEMAEKDMIGKDASSINTQVNEILAWNDENFESLKKIVARQSVVKKASALPQVGMLGVPDMIFPAPEAESTDFKSKLEACFSGSWKPRW